MQIRRIQPADDAAVAQVIRTVMTEFEAVGEGFSVLDAEVDTMSDAYGCPRSVFYVLEDETGIVGCGGLSELAGGESHICELKKMYFYPQIRGLGLGRLLGETLIVDAKRIGYTRMYIETLERMQAAVELYEKLGFSRQPQSPRQYRSLRLRHLSRHGSRTHRDRPQSTEDLITTRVLHFQ